MLRGIDGVSGVLSLTGEALREVAFPLGGIGTGTISLGGRGNLQDWEIFNRPAKGRNLPYSFFAIWAQAEGAAPIARVLERRFMPPFPATRLPTSAVSGLPRFPEVTSHGGYPLAQVDFLDPSFPLEVCLEAMNPFIPMNERDSGLPLASMIWSLTNPGDRPVEVTVCGSLFNGCGYDGQAKLGNRFHRLFGANLNEFTEQAGLAGIRMSSGKYGRDHPAFGTMALSVPQSSGIVTRKARWERAGWWDDAQEFWDDFSSDGLLEDRHAPTPSPEGQTDVGSLGVRLTVAPGETARIPFFITWHFPNLVNHWNESDPAVFGKRIGNWYAAQWPDAWSVAEYACSEWERLKRETRTFFDAFFESTLPAAVLDAASANASILRTTTCFRAEDGRLHGFEGCSDNIGCCPLNCTHVWNYAQSAAFLFPALERTVRLTDFEVNTRPNGDMAFRTLLPLTGEVWAFKPAADGQMGTIIRAYREWLQCGDRAYLETVWPGVRRALEFAWSPDGWDADRDGVMEGEQHNTYDIEFYGPNPLCDLLYLGALRAAEELAKAAGEPELAAEYRRVFESGSRGMQALFNGDYFVQEVIAPAAPQDSFTIAETHPTSLQPGEKEPRYQVGSGCLSDQLLGQWMARVAGLGDLVPPELTRSALSAIVRSNFRLDLTDHASVQRVYALNDEAGLLLCTWPNGGRPRYPFPYADEVWTGIEYHVAAHCIYEGLVDEGLRMVEAVRARHAGGNRNPWDEYECGHHYARAMSSWSLITALSGAHYDAPAGLLSFTPRLHGGEFRCFFTAGTAWGRFSLRTQESGRAEVEIAVLWGEVALRELRLPVAQPVRVFLDDVEIADSLSFSQAVVLRAGTRLRVVGVTSRHEQPD